MEVTLPGMMMEVSPVQLQNVDSLMEVTPSPMVTEVRVVFRQKGESYVEL